jgi:hypothetical protein
MKSLNCWRVNMLVTKKAPGTKFLNLKFDILPSFSELASFSSQPRKKKCVVAWLPHVNNHAHVQRLMIRLHASSSSLSSYQVRHHGYLCCAHILTHFCVVIKQYKNSSGSRKTLHSATCWRHFCCCIVQEELQTSMWTICDEGDVW